MAEWRKVTPAEAHRRLTATGSTTLLVCAYDDAAKCRDAHLEGAIPFPELKRRLPLAPDREVIFYCA